jgi:hypothetical protein
MRPKLFSAAVAVSVLLCGVGVAPWVGGASTTELHDAPGQSPSTVQRPYATAFGGLVLASAAEATQPAARVVADVPYGAGEKQKLDLYRPTWRGWSG